VPFKETILTGLAAASGEFDATVLNGLPVTICYDVGKAEPDVGFMNDYVENMWILIKKERKNKGPKWEVAHWIEKRLTNKDWAILEERAMEDYYER
jgi:GDP-D-mannose dehydratase